MTDQVPQNQFDHNTADHNTQAPETSTVRVPVCVCVRVRELNVGTIHACVMLVFLNINMFQSAHALCTRARLPCRRARLCAARCRSASAA